MCSTNAENYENEEIAKSLCSLYKVNSWVAVTSGKTWYPGEVKSIGDAYLEGGIIPPFLNHPPPFCLCPLFSKLCHTPR